MKKIVLALMALAGNLNAQAENYTYLTFVTTDGAKVSVKVENLKLTVSRTSLTAGSKTLDLSNLVKMYFSNTDETSEQSGIDDLQMDTILSEATEIYDLRGHRLDASWKSSNDKLPYGVYIVKAKGKTYKIVVK